MEELIELNRWILSILKDTSQINFTARTARYDFETGFTTTTLHVSISCTLNGLSVVINDPIDTSTTFYSEVDETYAAYAVMHGLKVSPFSGMLLDIGHCHKDVVIDVTPPKLFATIKFMFRQKADAETTIIIDDRPVELIMKDGTLFLDTQHTTNAKVEIFTSNHFDISRPEIRFVCKMILDAYYARKSN